ncbi:MAG: DUF4349 domain-containing protein [Methanomicrobiales archaeon]|nr:DUF4349 domain-containing protein [Methanomicrobiales archaeon]
MKFSLILALMLLCGLCLAGCLGVDTDFLDSRSSPQESNDALEKSSGVPSIYPTTAPLSGTSSSLLTGQKLIKTANLEVEVKDVSLGVEALAQIAASHGGYLSSSALSRGYADRLSATVTVRIPQPQFEAAIAAIKGTGTILSESVNSGDVTEEYIDLEARKGALQRQLDQYNRILEKVEKVEDVLKVQVEIERVQVELDRIEGRLRYLDNRIDLSTITVRLVEPAPIGGETGHNFIDVINEGIRGFLTTIDAIIILFFSLLPFLILGGAAYAVYRWRKGDAKIPPPSAEKGP